MMISGRFSWLRAVRRSLLLAALAGATQFAYASEYADAWGPAVGTTAPMLSAVDQDGNSQNLESLQGTNGLLFVFNRSVDW
ncbi:MAG: hypothetical protein AAGE43_17620 [Pseudomonadota bacterium]